MLIVQRAQSHIRLGAEMLRVKAGMFGTLCVVAGACALFAEARHSLTGVQVSAVLVDQFEQCQVEFQPKGESRRKEPMPCQGAFAFRAAIGENKVRVYKTVLALLRVPMADGSQRAVKVDMAKLDAFLMPLGSSVRVVYDLSKPDDVRLPLTLARVQSYLSLLGLGVFLLAIAFIGPILRAVLWAFSGKDRPIADEAAPELTRGQLALLGRRNALRDRAGIAPQSSCVEVRMAAIGGSRQSFGLRP